MDSAAFIRQVPRWLCALTALLFATHAAADSTPFEVAETTAARASLDFKIVIPKLLFLAVGTVVVGNVVPVRVAGNGGRITLAATTTTAGANNNSGEDTMPKAEVSATSRNTTHLPHPLINDVGGTTVALSSGKITDRAALWTYSDASMGLVPPGTHGGAAAYSGQVTYTATMP